MWKGYLSHRQIAEVWISLCIIPVLSEPCLGICPVSPEPLLLAHNYASLRSKMSTEQLTKINIYDAQHSKRALVKVHTRRGKLKKFRGQGIVREFNELSGKMKFFKMSGNLIFQSSKSLDVWS